VSGNTHGATPTKITIFGFEVANGTVIGDPDPSYDDCSENVAVYMHGKNIGDLLNSKNITWGWFQGGFKPTHNGTDGKAVCDTSHMNNLTGSIVIDYQAHHEPFQYYNSTSNPHHFGPKTISMIGKSNKANHQYDLTDFWNVVESLGNIHLTADSAANLFNIDIIMAFGMLTW